MTNNKRIWDFVFTGVLLLGLLYVFWNYDIEDYFWAIFVFVLHIYLYGAVRSFLSYKKRINDLNGDVLLNAKEKWDFLYQDIWVPFSILLVCVMLYMFFFNEELWYLLLNLPVLFKALFDKMILRNKLIVDDNKIAFSKAGTFSEIKFRLIKGAIFDEDEGRVTINYEKIIPPKYSFLSTKSRTLDIDEVEVVKSEIKVLERQGLFEKDWDDFKIILEQKSKEYDFGLSVVYPI